MYVYDHKRRIRCVSHGSRNRKGGDEARLRWSELKLGHAADRECRAVGRARSSSAAPRPKKGLQLACDQTSAARYFRPLSTACTGEIISTRCVPVRKTPVTRAISRHDYNRATSSSWSLTTLIFHESLDQFHDDDRTTSEVVAILRASLPIPLTFPNGLMCITLAFLYIFETYGTLFCERVTFPRRSPGRLEHTTRSCHFLAIGNLNETFAGTGASPVTRTRMTSSRGKFSRGTFGVDVVVTTSKRRLALNTVRTTSITLGRLRPLSSWLGSHTMTSRGQTKTPAVWGIDRVRWRSRGFAPRRWIIRRQTRDTWLRIWKMTVWDVKLTQVISGCKNYR